MNFFNSETTKEAIKDKAKSLLRMHNRNEAQNFHSENLLMLAMAFGNKNAIRHCEKRIESIDSDSPNYEIPPQIEKEVSAYYQFLVKMANEHETKTN